MLGGTSDSKGKTFAHSSFDLTLFAKRGGARLAVEDRNFTEQFSGPQVRKDGLFAPRRRQRNTHRAHDDCHHAVAAIAEPTYRLASAETARLRIGSNIAPRFSSCVIPIPIPVPASAARAAARLEPPAQYNHAYNGQVVERVMPEAEVRSVCMSMGLDLLTVACSWQSNDTCYVVLPNDGQAPVDTYRRHEIAHCAIGSA